MDSFCLASVTMIKTKTRTYIRFLSGDAISQPDMVDHHLVATVYIRILKQSPKWC